MSTVVSRRTCIVSSNALGVTTSLAAHPSGRVVIPFVFTITKHTGRLTQVHGAAVPFHGVCDRFPHKGAAASRAGDGIDLADDHIVEFNVHSHVYIFSTKLCEMMALAISSAFGSD